MIRMYGNKVQICRYKIEYNHNDNLHTCYAQTAEEAQHLANSMNGTISNIDTSNEDWLDGLEFDTRSQALYWLEQGQENYNQFILNQKLQMPDRLRADIDFLSIMTEATL